MWRTLTPRVCLPAFCSARPARAAADGAPTASDDDSSSQLLAGPGGLRPPLSSQLQFITGSFEGRTLSADGVAQLQLQLGMLVA